MHINEVSCEIIRSLAVQTVKKWRGELATYALYSTLFRQRQWTTACIPQATAGCMHIMWKLFQKIFGKTQTVIETAKRISSFDDFITVYVSRTVRYSQNPQPFIVAFV
jgi:hypothetical protein